MTSHNIKMMRRLGPSMKFPSCSTYSMLGFDETLRIWIVLLLTCHDVVVVGTAVSSQNRFLPSNNDGHDDDDDGGGGESLGMFWIVAMMCGMVGMYLMAEICCSVPMSIQLQQLYQTNSYQVDAVLVGRIHEPQKANAYNLVVQYNVPQQPPEPPTQVNNDNRVNHTTVNEEGVVVVVDDDNDTATATTTAIIVVKKTVRVSKKVYQYAQTVTEIPLWVLREHPKSGVLQGYSPWREDCTFLGIGALIWMVTLIGTIWVTIPSIFIRTKSSSDDNDHDDKQSSPSLKTGPFIGIGIYLLLTIFTCYCRYRWNRKLTMDKSIRRRVERNATILTGQEGEEQQQQQQPQQLQEYDLVAGI